MDKETIEEKIECEIFKEQCAEQIRQERQCEGIDCAWCLEDCCEWKKMIRRVWNNATR